MKPIVPEKETVVAILSRLGSEIVGDAPDAILTSVALLNFTVSCASRYDSHFARYGLSQGRFLILMFIYNMPEREWTPASLAAFGHVSKPTVTGLIQTLEKDGWVRRSPHPDDGRKVLVQLTTEGKSRLAEFLPDHFRRIGGAFSVMDKKEHAALRQLLAKASASLDRLANDTGSGLTTMSHAERNKE